MNSNVLRLLKELSKGERDVNELSTILEAPPNDILTWAKLAEAEGFINITTTKTSRLVYTEEGEEYLRDGLPETQILAAIGDGIALSTLKDHPMFSKGFGRLKSEGKVLLKDGFVTKFEGATTDDIERVFRGLPKETITPTTAKREVMFKGHKVILTDDLKLVM